MWSCINIRFTYKWVSVRMVGAGYLFWVVLHVPIANEMK